MEFMRHSATLLLMICSMMSCAENTSEPASEVPSAPAASSTIYYVDAANGHDDLDGKSEATAWKTLSRASQLKMGPGDRLLLCCGQEYEGVLEVTGKGTAEKRVEVGHYGEGNDPVIKGFDTSVYAVHVHHSDYLTIHGLEIVNTGRERLAGRTGIKVSCTDYGISHDIVVSDLYIHDVNGSLNKNAGGGSAILIENGGKTMASRFDGLTISDCHIRDCARNAMIWSGYYTRQDWLPNTRVVVRGNLIEGVPGDGIVPIGCDGALIEYNVMRDCPDILPSDQAAAGIWPWSCDNTVIQYNEVSGHKAPWDAQGYDCDYNCRNTLIQYNYSHDNYGGMVLVCDMGNERNYSIGNQGSIVRYNISIGDGVRPKPTRAGMFSPSIHIAGRVENTLIEHNIIHQNMKPSDDIDRTMICSDSWEGYADRTTLRRNIFYAPVESRFDMTKSTGNVFERNWYLGRYSSLPGDTAPQTSCPGYQDLVLAHDATGYEGLRQLMDEHELFGTVCRFVNKEKIEQFFSALEK